MRSWTLGVGADPRLRLIRYLLLAALLVAAESFLTTPYLVRTANWMLILAVAAMGANIISGYAGLVSVAHAAFMAIGAYVSALSMMKLGLPFPVAFVMACAMCGVISGAVGLLGNRVEPVYFIVVTYGFAVAVTLVIVNESWLTGGANGLNGVPPASFGQWMLSDDWAVYPMIAFVFTVALYFAQRLRNSRAGRAMVAGQLNVPAASSSGVDVNRSRIFAMVVGGIYLGAAGSLFAHVVRFLGPENFSISLTLLLYLILVVGGLGSNIGACLAVFLVVSLTEILRGSATTWLLLFGISIMVIMIVAPRGLPEIWGHVARLAKRQSRAASTRVGDG